MLAATRHRQSFLSRHAAHKPVSSFEGKRHIESPDAGRAAVPMNPLILKLQQFAPLSVDAQRLLDGMLREQVRQFGTREDIVREGDRPRNMCVILSGWACCYKMLQDGRRQITSLLIPGDLCDFGGSLMREVDYSVGTLKPVTIAELSQDVVGTLLRTQPQIALAFRWEALVAASIQREWTVSLGQRSACERIAHLLCELLLRLRSVGLARATSYDLPVTQSELADATGLTTVHVNRTLRDMRNQGLISMRDRSVTILDLAWLQDVGLFNPNYLHLSPGNSKAGLDGVNGRGTDAMAQLPRAPRSSAGLI